MAHRRDRTTLPSEGETIGRATAVTPPSGSIAVVREGKVCGRRCVYPGHIHGDGDVSLSRSGEAAGDGKPDPHCGPGHPARADRPIGRTRAGARPLEPEPLSGTWVGAPLTALEDYAAAAAGRGRWRRFFP